MKVQVNIKTLGNDVVSVDLTANPSDTAAAIKDRVTLLEPNPFPEQVLTLQGKPLADGSSLADSGVADGAVLGFEAKASAEAFSTQLAGLLESKGRIGIEELGLMYTLKHGVTPAVVLQGLGKQLQLPAFLEGFATRFAVADGQVAVVGKAAPASVTTQPLKRIHEDAAVQRLETAQPLKRIPEDAAVQRLSVSVAVRFELPYTMQAGDDIPLAVDAFDAVGAIKDRVGAEALVPFPERELYFQGASLDDKSSLASCGVRDTAQLTFVVRCTELALVAQLLVLLQGRGAASCTELNDLYCCRFGTPASQALKLLGWGEKLPQFFERHAAFSVERGCISAAAAAAPRPPPGLGQDGPRLLRLHAELADAGRDAALLKELDVLADALSASTFLNVSKVVKSGALAKGLAVPGDVGAELVLFVRGLGQSERARWLPGLSASVAAVLSEGVLECGGVEAVQTAADGTVLLVTRGGLGEVRILLSPDYGSYGEGVKALRGQSLESACSGGSAAFAQQKVRFVERQPAGVRATMRLLRFWRSRQQWSSPATRPSDDVLELAAAYAAARQPPADLSAAVAGALGTLAHFDELSVTWPLASRTYREEDVSPALLQQRPLLLDPTNPLVNLAAGFDASEVMRRAEAGFGM